MATLQSQLELVLGGLADLTSTVQQHNSRFETLDNHAGAAALIRSAKQDDIYGASNIVLPCPALGLLANLKETREVK